MANNRVIFEVVTTAKGTKVVQRQTEDLAKSVEKVDSKTKNLDKTQEKNYGRLKQGVIQTANGTKNFSKMAQTIGGGSSGLVGAYATLAANVFAASAAFNFLKNSARFDVLTEGITALGDQSGRTLSVMAGRLREVTGAAISVEESFRSAALGISGGFGEEELAGLAKVAKGASIALGRDLGDAFDRLTRGAVTNEMTDILFPFSQTELYFQRIEGGKTVSPHRDAVRPSHILYNISDDGATTNFHDRLIDDKERMGFSADEVSKPIETHILTPFKWYLFNSQKIHSVTNITTTRVAICIDIPYTYDTVYQHFIEKMII